MFFLKVFMYSNLSDHYWYLNVHWYLANKVTDTYNISGRCDQTEITWIVWIVSPGNTGFQPSQTEIKDNKYWPCGMLGPAMLEVRSFSSNSGHMNVWPSQAGILSF